MSFSGSIGKTKSEDGQRAEPDSVGYDEATVDCYRRRNEILSSTRRTEWWMAIAVLLIIVSVGFVVL
jgi:hypothetical protein